MKTLDIIDCAEFLKIERTHALKLAGEGTLPGAKIGKAWVFLEEDLVEYLRQQVRMQQRQRAADAGDAILPGIELTKRASPLARSPLAGRNNKPAKRVIPSLDQYEAAGSPQL